MTSTSCADDTAEVPVTTVPIFLHLQPVLAPLNIPEPPLLMSESESASTSASATESKDKGPKKHLHFIITLQDPVHSLRFTSVSQPCPADWLEVEYERSDWVEERLVDVLRTGVEVVAQDVSGTLAVRQTACPQIGILHLLIPAHLTSFALVFDCAGPPVQTG